jgi:hypothetical protein
VSTAARRLNSLARRASAARWLLLLSITALAVTLPASAARTDEVIRVPIGYPIKMVTTNTSIPANKPLKLLVTGKHFIDEKPNPRRLEFDAFYCYKGCEGGIVPSQNFYMAIEKQGWPSRCPPWFGPCRSTTRRTVTS